MPLNSRPLFRLGVFHTSRGGLSCVLWIILAAAFTGCTARTAGLDQTGLAAQSGAFVPARTGILPCRLWPKDATFMDRPQPVAGSSYGTEICAKLDAFVENGFSNQPLMKGYSSKFVMKAFETKQIENWDKALSTIWSKGTKPDATASERSGADSSRSSFWESSVAGRFLALDDGKQKPVTAAGYYRRVVEKNPQWLLWLAQASAAAKHVDSVLAPFVLYAEDQAFDDRGLQVLDRQAEVVLLLIDTSNGQLLWSGGRRTSIPVRKLGTDGAPLTPAPWDAVIARLFFEDIWREYPGRELL